MSKDIINKLIQPWTENFDPNYQRNYYFNPETKDSVWELPEEYQKILLEYKDQYQEAIDIDDDEEEEKLDGEQNEDEKNKNLKKYITNQTMQQIQNQNTNVDSRNFLDRPARKQLEQSLASQHAYRQGDEDYNIWYDKFQTDNKQNVKEKEVAQTRCDPELDIGYSKADLYEKSSSYFCIHFCKGCCCEGANCKFYHRIPSLSESQFIDNSRDIFGRARFNQHREDMQGVGSFMKESRSLCVTDWKIAGGDNPIDSMYEIFFRHFSAWGEVEDITVYPNKGVGFIKYAHRCMAEFAKEAMQSQSLDQMEILTIKWSLEEPEDDEVKKENPDQNIGNEKKKEKKNKKVEDRINLYKAMQKRQNDLQEAAHDEILEKKRKEMYEIRMQKHAENMYKEDVKNREILNNVSKMNSILNKLDDPDYGKDDPENNDAPLFFK